MTPPINQQQPLNRRIRWIAGFSAVVIHADWSNQARRPFGR